MLEIRRSTQFKKDLKKVIKQRKNLDLLEEVVSNAKIRSDVNPYNN